jgi:hypothetical protein
MLIFGKFSVIPWRFINLLEFLALDKFSDTSILNFIKVYGTLRPLICLNGHDSSRILDAT